MSGLALTVGSYTFPEAVEARISKESIKHPDTDAVIGWRERWDVSSRVDGVSVAALHAALAAVEAGLAGGQDVVLSDGTTTAHQMVTANARNGVQLTKPVSFGHGAGAGQWATAVRFEFSLEAEFYEGNPYLLWETSSYTYEVREKERRAVLSGEIVCKPGSSAYWEAVGRNPGVFVGWQGPFARVTDNGNWNSRGTRATYSYEYVRGPVDAYEEYEETWEIEAALTDFVHVPVLGGGDPVKLTTVLMPAKARQFGHKSSLSQYPAATSPTWAADLKPPQIVTRRTPEKVTEDGSWKYTTEWRYEFERVSDFSFPA